MKKSDAIELYKEIIELEMDDFFLTELKKIFYEMIQHLNKVEFHIFGDIDNSNGKVILNLIENILIILEMNSNGKYENLIKKYTNLKKQITEALY